jgi:ketosteroid isomerase-like protein
MRPDSQSALGKAQLRQAYDAAFKAITLHVKFTIHEIVLMSPEWAFVRTDSAGTNKSNATGAISAEGRKDLFILHKSDDGAWKIARYSFSSTNPPPR